MRLVALLLLLAVLPTVELAEQGMHLVEHLFAHESPDHSAHHDAVPGDEHGCTDLMHLCGTHTTQVTAPYAELPLVTTELPGIIAAGVPPALVDLNALEPPHRPPIA